MAVNRYPLTEDYWVLVALGPSTIILQPEGYNSVLVAVATAITPTVPSGDILDWFELAPDNNDGFSLTLAQGESLYARASGSKAIVKALISYIGSAQGTRAYSFATNTRQNVASTSSAAISLPTLGVSREIMAHASTRCFVRFGTNGVAAAQVGAGQLILEASERFHLVVPEGVTHFRAIRDTADGSLTITAVL